jgi:hypothetical protein
LKDVGYTDQQAEVQAEIMAEAFIHNLDSLVSRDYLDVRLDTHGAEIKGQFKLVYWMLTIILATTPTPYLQKLFVLLAG